MRTIKKVLLGIAVGVALSVIAIKSGWLDAAYLHYKRWDNGQSFSVGCETIVIPSSWFISESKPGMVHLGTLAKSGASRISLTFIFPISTENKKSEILRSEEVVMFGEKRQAVVEKYAGGYVLHNVYFDNFLVSYLDQNAAEILRDESLKKFSLHRNDCSK